MREALSRRSDDVIGEFLEKEGNIRWKSHFRVKEFINIKNRNKRKGKRNGRNNFPSEKELWTIWWQTAFSGYICDCKDVSLYAIKRKIVFLLFTSSYINSRNNRSRSNTNREASILLSDNHGSPVTPLCYPSLSNAPHQRSWHAAPILDPPSGLAPCPYIT